MTGRVRGQRPRGRALRRSAAAAAVSLAAVLAASPTVGRAEPLAVETRIGDGAWQRTAAVEARVGTTVSLRVRPIAGTIR